MQNGDRSGIGWYLNGERNYESIFGVMFDVCAQTDCPKFGQLAFDLIVERANLLEMCTFSTKIKRFNGPVGGRQGPWGRWNETLEDKIPSSGEDTFSKTVQRGAASSSNALEGGINKKMKIATGCSLPFSTLLLKAQAMCSNLTNKLDYVGFSLRPDYMGDCKYVTHSKQTGRKSAQQTGSLSSYDRSNCKEDLTQLFQCLGRDNVNRFKRAQLLSGDYLHSLWNFKIKGTGAASHYICASEATKRTMKHWFTFDKKHPTE